MYMKFIHIYFEQKSGESGSASFVKNVSQPEGTKYVLSMVLAFSIVAILTLHFYVDVFLIS